VREALLAYLKKSRRLSALHTNDPLWTRHDRAGEPGSPLTSRFYANNLKKYAAKAGMRRVNIHQTRHTYARIIFEDSGDWLETQSALDQRALDSGGAHGGIQHLPPHDPPESNTLLPYTEGNKNNSF
jgi:integrase